MKALVVYKKSAYRIYVQERREPRIRRLLAEGDMVVARMERSHREHRHTLDTVRRVLKAEGLKATLRYRAQPGDAAGCDLVITVGGDGTLLDASHIIAGTPVLGVNSTPSTSRGFFCCATARDFRAALRRHLAGKLPRATLQRLQLEVGDRPQGPAVLNDVLFTHPNPAHTSRYFLEWNGRHEEQRSSGVWIAPAAGSTAGIGSAGGKRLPPRSRRFQFVVREPYRHPKLGCTLTRGFVKPHDELRLRSKMRDGICFLDGPHIAVRVRYGDVVRVHRSPTPLVLLGVPA